MEKTGNLVLELMDVYGVRLNERVDVILRHQELTDTAAVRGANAAKIISVRNLHGTPRGLYRLFIDPPSYLPVTAFLNIEADKPTERVYTFAVDIEKVMRVQFPSYAEVAFAHALLQRSASVLGFKGASGQKLYDDIDDVRRAGMLNIMAKTRRTRLAGGAPVYDSIKELRELRGDRFFAVVPHKLREDVKNSMLDGSFFEAPAALHRPPDGFSHAGSFKTPDRYGNLQITFFNSGPDWVADIDIDDANGFEHVFQVARNHLTGRPTHPYNIQQILIRDQEVDPGYKLIVREDSGTKKTAAGGDV